MADDWWDRLYDDASARRNGAGEKRLNIKLTRTRPENEPLPDAARALLPDDPRRAARIRFTAYNGSAAAAGWWLGITQWCTQGITESGRDGGVGEGVWVGIGLIVAALVLELRSHRMRDPGRPPLIRFLGWLLRIPLASAVLALALYGPNAAL